VDIFVYVIHVHKNYLNVEQNNVSIETLAFKRKKVSDHLRFILHEIKIKLCGYIEHSLLKLRHALNLNCPGSGQISKLIKSLGFEYESFLLGRFYKQVLYTHSIQYLIVWSVGICFCLFTYINKYLKWWEGNWEITIMAKFKRFGEFRYPIQMVSGMSTQIIRNFTLFPLQTAEIWLFTKHVCLSVKNPGRTSRLLDPGCGPTNGSLVLELDRILQDPIEILQETRPIPTLGIC
jgi:hypothetical protein